MQVKFIDMSGILGLKLSIVGDPHCDWAMLYLSLLGYDSILHEARGRPSRTYLTTMREWFEKWYIGRHSQKRFGYLRTLTAFILLLTLEEESKEEIVAIIKDLLK